jgi:hypothetical protein
MLCAPYQPAVILTIERRPFEREFSRDAASAAGSDPTEVFSPAAIVSGAVPASVQGGSARVGESRDNMAST